MRGEGAGGRDRAGPPCHPDLVFRHLFMPPTVLIFIDLNYVADRDTTIMSVGTSSCIQFLDTHYPVLSLQDNCFVALRMACGLR
jgi:hypothetical protein